MRDEAEAALSIGSEAPSASPAKPLGCSPFVEPDAKRVEARRVRTEAELRPYVGTGQAGPGITALPECGRPSAWYRVPMRPAGRDGDVLYEAALNTLDELEASLSTKVPHTNINPAASGA